MRRPPRLGVQHQCGLRKSYKAGGGTEPAIPRFYAVHGVKGMHVLGSQAIQAAIFSLLVRLARDLLTVTAPTTTGQIECSVLQPTMACLDGSTVKHAGSAGAVALDHVGHFSDRHRPRKLSQAQCKHYRALTVLCGLSTVGHCRAPFDLICRAAEERTSSNLQFRTI